MGASGEAIAIRSLSSTSVLSRAFAPADVPPALLLRQAVPRRTKIWEFNPNLHCSIIGTCLSTADLRQVLKGCGIPVQGCSDHDLHGVAVTLAARQDDAARQLHKALDHRHKLAINQFAKADTEEALRGLWREAMRRGEIPGAYWATLTHKAATHATIREAFGEVHMLSHLVGSANRADIRRLCALETEKAELEERVQRQQQALHEAITSRDAQIGALRQALADRLVAEAASERMTDDMALRDLVTDRERRLGTEIRRRTALEERLAASQADRDAERAARSAAERDNELLRRELAALEAALPAAETNPETIRLEGLNVLYIGGRPSQVAHIRGMIERLGGTLLHHDGGIENHQTLLAGLTSRCDLAVFPVDCISHDAANLVKSLCRKAAKRYVPLRSAGVASLLAALQTSDISRLADAAP